jgi:hypothetical protein
MHFLQTSVYVSVLKEQSANVKENLIKRQQCLWHMCYEIAACGIRREKKISALN